MLKRKLLVLSFLIMSSFYTNLFYSLYEVGLNNIYS